MTKIVAVFILSTSWISESLFASNIDSIPAAGCHTLAIMAAERLSFSEHFKKVLLQRESSTTEAQIFAAEMLAENQRKTKEGTSTVLDDEIAYILESIAEGRSLDSLPRITERINPIQLAEWILEWKLSESQFHNRRIHDRLFLEHEDFFRSLDAPDPLGFSPPKPKENSTEAIEFRSISQFLHELRRVPVRDKAAAVLRSLEKLQEAGVSLEFGTESLPLMQSLLGDAQRKTVWPKLKPLTFNLNAYLLKKDPSLDQFMSRFEPSFNQASFDPQTASTHDNADSQGGERATNTQTEGLNKPTGQSYSRREAIDVLLNQKEAPVVRADGYVDPRPIQKLFKDLNRSSPLTGNTQLPEDITIKQIAIAHFNENPNNMFYIVRNVDNFYFVGLNPPVVIPHRDPAKYSVFNKNRPLDLEPLIDTFFGTSRDSVHPHMQFYHLIALDPNHKLHPVFQEIGPDLLKQLIRDHTDELSLRTEPLKLFWGKIKDTENEYLFMSPSKRSIVHLALKNPKHNYFDYYPDVELLTPDGKTVLVKSHEGRPTIPQPESPAAIQRRAEIDSLANHHNDSFRKFAKKYRDYLLKDDKLDLRDIIILIGKDKEAPENFDLWMQVGLKGDQDEFLYFNLRFHEILPLRDLRKRYLLQMHPVSEASINATLGTRPMSALPSPQLPSLPNAK